MGGGSLMTPLLILLFGVHHSASIRSRRWEPICFSPRRRKRLGTAIHSKNGNVDWRVAGLLAAGSVPATVLTSAEAESDHSRYYLHVDRGDTHHCGRGDLLAPPHPRLRPGPRRRPIANPLRGSDHCGVRCSAWRDTTRVNRVTFAMSASCSVHPQHQTSV